MRIPVHDTIHSVLNDKLLELESHFGGDFLTYYGPIFNSAENRVLKVVEDIVTDKKDKLFVMITTSGGSAEVVERLVNIFRYHYKEVNFIIPDYAYSAGTILCMSGDNIYMYYHSVLGPIDPQVKNKDNRWVPALGYLDKVNKLIEKAQNDELTQAEFLILKEMDLAELRGYEQAKELTIDLLKNWLVKYKFKNWDKHKTNPALLGQDVTKEEKEQRAEDIAKDLSDNSRWKSHGRPININALKELRLEIHDFSEEDETRQLIKSYYELLEDYLKNNNFEFFIHTRNFI